MFYIGDQVAVLDDQKVTAIDSVEVIEREFLRLKNGGIYRLDGVSASHNKLHIVPAMPEHFKPCDRSHSSGGSAGFRLQDVLEDNLSLKEILGGQRAAHQMAKATRADQSTTQKRLASMAQKQPTLKFETLKGRAQQIVTRLTNSIAFQNRDCCSVDDFAEEFKTTPGRLQKTLKQLEEAGLIELKDDLMQIVPTKKLLKHQDKKLSETQAAKLIGQYKRGKYQ